MKQLFTTEELAQEYGMSEEEFTKILQSFGVLDENKNLVPELKDMGLQREVEIREK